MLSKFQLIIQLDGKLLRDYMPHFLNKMPNEIVDTIWDAVFDRVGSDLRGVIRYRSTGFDTKFREDIEGRYLRTDFQDIVDNTIVEQLMQKRRDKSFRVGELHGIIRVFDEANILAWNAGIDPKAGVMIAIERDGSRSSIEDLEWAIRFLDESIAPLIEEAAE